MVEALSVVRTVAHSTHANMMAVCSGGIIASMVMAHLAATGDRQVTAFTMLVTVLDQSSTGLTGSLIDEQTAQAAMKASDRQGYLDGNALAEVFAWLRPNDLIWNYWVNNYLLGRKPPRRSTSSTGTPTRHGCRPGCIMTFCASPCPTRWSHPMRR